MEVALYYVTVCLRVPVGNINRPHTVNHRQNFMPSFSASPFSLFGAFRSPLLQLWLKARDHATLSVGLALGLIILYVVRYLASPYRKLPPGPRGYPIIGNVFELGKGPWLYFTDLQKKYGQFAIYIFLFPPIFEVYPTIGR